MYKVILSFLFNFLWRRAAEAVSWLISYYREKQARVRIKLMASDQAAKVEELSAQIKKLHDEGKEVPVELTEKLRAETNRLINLTFD